MTYPDGEKLHYAYDNGGLLKAAWGEKNGNRYDYITKLLYDEFGQRTNLVYGNGTKTTYSYDDKTRRLDHLTTMLKDGRTIQNIAYDYDLVGNVGETWNNIQVPTNTALPAGPVKQKFEYDDLYQLVDGKGWYSFGPGKENNYHNEFFYDTIGNFVKKNQVHKVIQPSTTETLPKETNYVLKYVYGSNKPHAVTDAGDKLYAYDDNGNMTGWTSKVNGTRRVITWNEENRVKQIDDNGKSTYFLYDDAGERVVKRGQHGESIYVNRFFSIRNGELGTKHMFAGETRVVSKLVKTPPTNTANTTNQTNQINQTNTTTTTPGEQGLDNGRGKKLGIIKRLPDGYQTGINPPVEKDQFYYHGDHLGSSNMITDAYGAVYQHLEYFPYGETWIEEGGSYGGNTPGYKFTGKELDPETGLYYYGARYYDAVLSRWISADPIFSAYLDGKVNGGIYLPINMGLFSYSASNPVKYVDPDGQKWYSQTDLTPEQLNSGKYLVVTMPLSKDTKLTLYTDDPNKDIKQSYVTTSAGTKRLEKVITDVSDPGTGLDRPTGISDPVVTSGVSESRKHPVLGTTRPHHGMDISSKSKRSAGIAGTEILAPAGGKVLRVGYQEKGAGKYVVISHGSGRESKFFHLKDASVKAGDYVLRGQNLGTVGKTGGISSGEHIHWEHRESGKVIDPNTRLKDAIPMKDN